MRALSFDSTGELHLVERPKPQFNDTDHYLYARIHIVAFGINRADLLQKAGHYPPPPGVPKDILGLEFAGVIESFSDEAGGKDSSFSLGDRVMGICSGAAYAEYIIVPVAHLIPIPKHISFSEAAAIPEAHLTAFDALQQANVKENQAILIHAIGSGVGTAASHLAHFFGAKVYGTTRSPWKAEKAIQNLPIQKVFLSENGSFSHHDNDRLRFDLILDFIGATYLKENLSVLKSQGTLMMIGLLGGTKGELNLGLLLAKRAKIIGTVLRSRSIVEKAVLTQQYTEKILPYLGNTYPVQNDNLIVKLEPVQLVYDYKDINLAHQHLANGQVWSKLVALWNE